jgi:competence protein ComEC
VPGPPSAPLHPGLDAPEASSDARQPASTGGAVLAVGVCWSAGIALGVQAGLTPLVLVLAMAATLAATMLARAGLGRLAALGLLALLLGQLRLALAAGPPIPDPLADRPGLQIVTGRVLDAPIPRGGRMEVAIEVEAVAAAPLAPSLAPGPPTSLDGPRPQVLVRAPSLRVNAGDRIEARGRLSRPRSRPGWPLADLLARRGIFWVIDTGGARLLEPGGASVWRFLDALRGYVATTTRNALPEPHASLVAGIVFGARVGLPPELKAAMSATGTSHLTAVSGANVAMVAGAATLLAGRFLGRLPAALVATVLVWLYTVLVGAPPSALRAAWMATVVLLARGAGREADSTGGLVLATALLLGWEPGLAADLGFQLSVAATAGLILLSPGIERRLGRLPWLPRGLRGEASIAVAAQVATLPILVGAFQRVSLVSLPANLLAAPLIPPLMGLGAALATLGFLPGIDMLLAWACWLFANGLLGVIEWSASLPGAQVAVGRAPDWLPWVWYGALACWVAAGSADTRALGLRPGPLRAAALALPLVLVGWLLVGWLGVGRSSAVEVALLDVDPAAVFVRTPSGRSVLVSAASPGRGIVPSVGSLLDLTEHGVDVSIGPDGLRTGVDLLALTIPDDADAEDSAAEPAVTPLTAGARVDLGDGVAVQVVDARLAGQDQAPVLDLAILVDDLAVLLPGPGDPSARWADLKPDAVSVGRLPSSAVAWARTLPERRWLLLVGEPAQARARGESGVPLLTRRAYGQVELVLEGGRVAVRTERCETGEACQIELPPPVRTRLLP